MNTNKYQVVPKSDYLTGARVWSVQEYMSNQFCGHWFELSWTTDLAEANRRLREARRT
jgi:hypothetical protein